MDRRNEGDAENKGLIHMTHKAGYMLRVDGRELWPKKTVYTLILTNPGKSEKRRGKLKDDEP